MTLPRLEAISKRWDEIPPLSVSVAAIAYGLGMEKPDGSSKAKSDKLQTLVDSMGATGLGSGIPEWLKEARAQEAANKS